MFKPFKISQKAKQNLLKVKATSDQNHGELLNKINNLLTIVVHDTPQPTEEISSKLKIRQPTKTIAILEQSSDNESELNTPSHINPILVTANKQWKSLTKPTSLFDTGADSNCILEGLIPTRYFEKTSKILSTTNGSKLKIKYKLSNAIIESQDYRIETPFFLVKDLKNEVIFGTPFIKTLFPLEISEEGILTKHNGKSIIFRFIRKPITKQINLIQQKSNQINFLKEEISFKNIDSQLNLPQIQQKIKKVLHSTESTICSDLPNNFWSTKKHLFDFLC